MILRRAICNSISPARCRTYNESRNQWTRTLQFCAGHSFQEIGTLFHEMDNLKRDDHKSEPLDAILRRANPLSPGEATPQCADPETLAAYYDRSLVQSDRDRLEAHFADCARCQAQLAAIAHADESASAKRPRFGASLLQSRWRVAIPVFAAAAALLILIRSMRSSDGDFRGARQIAMAKHEAPLADLSARAPAPVSPPGAARAAPSTSELAMNEAMPRAPREREHRKVPERRDELRERAMPLAKAPQLPNSQDERTARAPGRNSSNNPSNDVASVEAPEASGRADSAPAQVGSTETAAPQSPEPPAAATAADAMSKNAPAPRALPGASSLAATNKRASEESSATPGGGGDATTGAVAGPAIATEADSSRLSYRARNSSAGAAYGPAIGAIAGSTMPSAAAPPEVIAMISPPNQSSGWQVGRNGMILRRDADGRIQPQHSGVTTDLTAGAAPSTTVCWIVGRSGTIVRTTDGEHWELVRSPTRDNLVRVASDSVEHAIVTTATGQNFATSDGGMSWHRQ
jgi:hypothetical protein